MEPCTNFNHFFCPTFLLPDDDPVEEEGLAQSRQGAKEDGNELRETNLCAFAALREILLKLARGDFQTGTETFPRESREDISTDPNFSLAVADLSCQSRA